MKAYKVVLLVVDHDGLGTQGIKSEIEATRFANHCMSPKVMGLEEADIGEWRDSHPLNYRTTQTQEFARLFPYEKQL